MARFICQIDPSCQLYIAEVAGDMEGISIDRVTGVCVSEHLSDLDSFVANKV